MGKADSVDLLIFGRELLAPFLLGGFDAFCTVGAGFASFVVVVIKGVAKLLTLAGSSFLGVASFLASLTELARLLL